MKNEKPHVITESFLADYFKITAGEAKEIHAKLQRIVYENGQTIVKLGDAADGLYFIEEGQATVFNGEGEEVNVMTAGQYFGEYAILAEEPRLSTVKAHGRVVAYRMLPEDFLAVVAKHPRVTGRLLKQVYGQITTKHTRIVSLTRRFRGVMWSPAVRRDSDRKNILVTYGLTAVVFLLAFLLAPHMETPTVWWQLLPVVFLMAFTLWTRRVVEGMLLTVLLLAGMLNKGNFLFGFGEMMVEGIGNPDTAQTIVIMAMVEAVAALLAAAGVATAFKKLAEKYVKTRRGSMGAMLLIMALVCVDECLNVRTAGYCMNDIQDRHRIPREDRALLGSCSMAVCSLIPFSLWSAYICGWVAMYFKNGGNVFLRSIPFNLVGIFSLLLAAGLCFDRLPRTKQLKAASIRVQQGGSLWPKGAERYFETDWADDVVGKPINLLLPMAVWAVSSVVCGTLQSSRGFGMDAVSGLVLTLIFMFLLYVGQRLMTPKEYFDILAEGVGNSLMLILLLVLAERIAACLEQLGFDAFLEKAIPALVGGRLWCVPAVLFVLCALVCLGIGSCWGMYGLGIPITMYLCVRLGLPVPLCLGAVLAAGIIGESLCPYMDDTSPIVAAVGCGPRAYRRLRISYWVPVGLICTLGYLVLGLLFC